MRVHIEADRVVQEALSKPYRSDSTGKSHGTVVFVVCSVVIAVYLIWIGWSP